MPALVSPGEPPRVHTAVSDNAPAGVRPEVAQHQRHRVAFLAIAAATLALWIVGVGYHGILHDARLYSLQALGRLQPELLGQDLYLRYGSQDRFTFFSPIYAALIAPLGLESAAALITFLSQVAFFTAAAFLTRQLLPMRFVLFSIALLVAIPSEYGPGNMFHAVEPFITPRMAAEALALAAVAAAVSKKHALTAAFLVAGLALHPLMAMAGVAIVLVMTVILPRPRLAPILAGVALIALALLIMIAPSLRLDDAWRTVILDRMGYVFMSQWSIESWTRACAPLVELTVALLVLPQSRSREMAWAALLIGLSGLLLTIYGADILRIALVAQSQPWRWLWLTNTLTIILLPAIFSACWERGYLGRATVAALVAMWLFRSDAYGMVLMPVAIALAAFSRSSWGQSPATRLLWFGSLAVVALGIAWSLANNALYAGAINPVAGLSAPVATYRDFAEDGLAPAAVLFLVWLLATRAPRMAQIAAAAVTCIAVICVLPFAYREWTSVRLDRPAYEAFAPWRARIPVGTEVLYLDDPIDAWVLLQRPLYLVIDQTGSALFSRNAALEMERRDAVLTKYFPQAHFMMPKVHKPANHVPTLAGACASGELKFIVTRIDLKAPALENAPSAAPRFRGLRLYQCPGSNG